MRKALMSMILAATVLSPVAAEAQRSRGGGERVREQNEQTEQTTEQRQERQQQRQERQQQREARQAPQVQQQPQVEQQQAPVVQQRDRSGEGRRNWRGNNDGNTGNTGNTGTTTTTRDRSGEGRRGWRGGGNQESAYPQAWQGDPNDPRLRRYQETERRNQQRYDNDRRGDHRGEWRGDRDGRRGDRNWNRNWRNDNRYDWQRWRYSNRNLYRVGRYHSPYRNWNYSRFNIGIFLQPLFYSQRYWIGDPWQYRLPPAYPGTQWVRYYNDVLLVDIYTGEVIDVIYGFFW